MNIYESIMQGLTEALEYTQGRNTARSVSVTLLSEDSDNKTEKCQNNLGTAQNTDADSLPKT